MHLLPLKELKTALYQRLKAALAVGAPSYHVAPFAALSEAPYPLCIIAGLGGEEDLDSRDVTVYQCEATLELRSAIEGAEDLLDVLNVILVDLGGTELSLGASWQDLGLTVLKRWDVGAAWEDDRPLIRALAIFNFQLTPLPGD